MKKKLIILAITVLLILSLTVIFVACDDYQNNTPVKNCFTDIDIESFEKTLDSFIAYSIDFTKTIKDSVSIMNGGFINKPQEESNFNRGNGWLGEFVIANNSVFSPTDIGDDTIETYNGAILYFYDTAENASAATTKISENINPYISWFNKDIKFTLRQNENMLIAETKQGMFDEIKTHSLSQADRNKDTIKFIFDTLYKEMRSDNCRIELGEFNDIVIKNGEVLNFGIFAMPSTGNREKSYYYTTSMYFDFIKDDGFETLKTEEEQLFNENKYTAESYIISANLNSTDKYYKFYKQYKIGAYFEENTQGYTLEELYYDGNSFTIPAYYNNKPVNKINYYIDYNDNYNDKLTSINYEGTISEWKKFLVDYEWVFSDLKIICTDGTIEL